MKKIFPDNIVGTVKAPFLRKTFEHLNAAMSESVDAVIKGLINYIDNDVIILWGCDITYGGGVGAASVTQGAIYYNGEVYQVDENLTITVGVGQTLVWYIETSYDIVNSPADPVLYSDGNTYNQHQINKFVLTNGPSGSGLVDYSDSSVKRYKDVVGKVRKDAGAELRYLEDAVQGNNGVLVDNTVSNLLNVEIDGLSSNPLKFLRANFAGNGIFWSTFDMQANENNINGLFPSSVGSVAAGPLTAPSGNARTYLFAATFEAGRDTTTPVHKLSVRLNGFAVQEFDGFVIPSGYKQHVIVGIIPNVAAGDVIDAHIIPVGSTDQYIYRKCNLTIFGMPA